MALMPHYEIEFDRVEDKSEDNSDFKFDAMVQLNERYSCHY